LYRHQQITNKKNAVDGRLIALDDKAIRQMGSNFNKMQNAFKRRREFIGTLNTNNSDHVVLTPAMFLALYFAPKEFLNYGDGLRDSETDDLEAMLVLTNEQVPMAFNRRIRTDRNGNPYSYQNFIRSKGTEGVKIVLGGKLLQFIKDYHQGKVSTNFTLNELVEEAEKSL